MDEQPLDRRARARAIRRRALQDVKEIFVAQPNASGTTRIAFGRDGTLYMTIQGAVGNRAQDPNDVAGKILRLRDDGSVPPDNPFVGRPGYRPEVFTLGHRSNVGIAVHPETGAIWTTENGPNGGDEINMLVAGRNYGWPVVSYGRTYPGAVGDRSAVARVDGAAAAFLGAVYCRVRNRLLHRRSLPGWKGNVFVGGMRTGEIDRTGRIERIVFNGAARKCAESRCSPSSRSGSAMFGRDRTACCTPWPRMK